MTRSTSGKASLQIRETDLFAPIRDFFIQQQYIVRSEVLSCDMTATKGDELVIIELKRSLNIKLLIQATERQKYSTSVYVAIAEPTKKSKHYRGAMRLLKRLQLGLITVRFSKLGPRMHIVFDPPTPDLVSKSKKVGMHRRALLTELAGRSGDYNVGGSTQTPLVTAYRELAIFIACCLKRLGPQTPGQLRKLGAEDNAGKILYRNHYHWFHRVSRGLYKITTLGIRELDQFPDIVKDSNFRIAVLIELKKGLPANTEALQSKPITG